MVQYGKQGKITVEKIKIYVTEWILNILEKDAEGFEFFKNDGRTVNKNALLTNLIVNYHNSFTERQSELLTFFKSRISSAVAVGESTLNDMCFDLCEKLNEKSAAPNGEKFDRLISLKPTKESEPIIGYIENYCLAGRTLSEYFRSMLASYAALPQDKREQIIFKRQYEDISAAIKEKKRIFLTMRRGKRRELDCAPYCIALSKEELHCYVLVAADGCKPVRLSRIACVKPLAAGADFTIEQIEVFEKMKTYGPQFACRANEGEVMVELTEKGIEKFARIYVHRPVPVRVEGNRYYFNCAHKQIVQYFVRLGSDAAVVYPQSVRNDICAFHRRALQAYTK